MKKILSLTVTFFLIVLITGSCKKDDYYERGEYLMNMDVGTEWIYKIGDEGYLFKKNVKLIESSIMQRVHCNYDYTNQKIIDTIKIEYIKKEDDEWLISSDSNFTNNIEYVSAKVKNGDVIDKIYVITDLKKKYNFNDNKIRCFYAGSDDDLDIPRLYMSSIYEVLYKYYWTDTGLIVEEETLVSTNIK